MKFQHVVGSQLIFEWCGLNNNNNNNNNNPLSLSKLSLLLLPEGTFLGLKSCREGILSPFLSCLNWTIRPSSAWTTFMTLLSWLCLKSPANCTPVSFYAIPMEGERKEFYSLKGLQFMQRSPPTLHSASSAFSLLSIISTAITVTTKISPL